MYRYLRFICVFFFKQKTAYEMRISDWSSDVCSSDLTALQQRSAKTGQVQLRMHILGITAGLALGLDRAVRDLELIFDRGGHRLADALGIGVRCEDDVRSEEHTSELQPLMRISYAVFCLNKKKKSKNLSMFITCEQHTPHIASQTSL